MKIAVFEVIRTIGQNIPAGGMVKKPCRYFKNGEGNCSPKNGRCDFDHTIIPFSERQQCFNKQSCRYKPFCIFYHPEGQDEDGFQANVRKPEYPRYAFLS